MFCFRSLQADYGARRWILESSIRAIQLNVCFLAHIEYSGVCPHLAEFCLKSHRPSRAQSGCAARSKAFIWDTSQGLNLSAASLCLPPGEHENRNADNRADSHFPKEERLPESERRRFDFSQNSLLCFAAKLQNASFKSYRTNVPASDGRGK